MSFSFFFYLYFRLNLLIVSLVFVSTVSFTFCFSMDFPVKNDEGRLVNPTLTSREDKGKGKLEEKKVAALLLKRITCTAAPDEESFQTYLG